MKDEVLGEVIDFPFEVTLNTDSVDRDVIPIGQPEKHRNIANNGIMRDGGLTEVYKKDETSIGSVYYASNGVKIEVESNGYISLSENSNKVYIGSVSKLRFQEILKLNDALDVIPTSDGKLIALYFDVINSVFTLKEISLLGVVLNQKNFPSLTSSPVAGAIVINCSNNIYSATRYIMYSYFDGVNYGVYNSDNISQTTSLSTSFNGLPSDAVTLNMVEYISAFSIGTGFILSLGAESMYYKKTFGTSKYYSNKTFEPLIYSKPDGISEMNKDAKLKGLLHFYNNTLSLFGIYDNGTNIYGGCSITCPSGTFIYTPKNSGVYSTNRTIYSYNATPFSCVYTFDSKINCNTNSLFTSLISSGTALSSCNNKLNIPDIFSGDKRIVPSTGNPDFIISINTISGYYGTLSFSGSSYCGPGNNVTYLGQIMSGTDVKESLFNNVYTFVYTDLNKIRHVVTVGLNNDFIFSEFANGVVSLNVCDHKSIIDTNNKILIKNYNNFVNTSISQGDPFLISSTYDGSTDSVFVESSFSQFIDNGTLPSKNGNSSVIFGSVSDFYPYGSTAIYVKNSLDIYSKLVSSVYSSGSMTLGGQYQFGYIPSPYEPIPASLKYNYRNGIAQLDNSSVIISTTTPCPSYDSSNFLLQKYIASFRLYGQQYAYDGYYIYNVPLSAGSSGTAGTPVIIAVANGLDYLCMTPKAAVFYSSFDNSLFAFSGGRDVERIICFSNKPTIRSAKYCVANDELVVQTDSSLIFVRNGIVSEISPPFTPYTAYELQESKDAVWCVNKTTGASTSYYYQPISGSVVIPLSWQSGYYGIGSNRRKIVNRIVMRLLYKSATSSQVTLQWNWITQDSYGTNTATVTPTTDASGYAIIDWVPPNNAVLSGSIGFVTADATQKIVLLSVTAYMVPEADAQTLNHAL